MPGPSGDIAHIVVGVGYVGRRLLAALPPGSAIGWSRAGPGSGPAVQTLDLDAVHAALPPIPPAYSLTYTVPPAKDAGHDRRLERLLASLERPPRRVVYLSTTGVYGDRAGARVDELTPPAPSTQRAERRVDAERRLETFCQAGGIPLVILRVPGIYGPGRLGLERIRDGVAVLDERDANPGNRIHVDDLVRCCLAALDATVPPGIYNVGDGDERSSTWFATEVARRLGIEAPPTVRRSRAEREFSAKRLSFLGESRRVDLTKMKSLLGVEPTYADAADGIAASLKEDEEAQP
ncbi:MAG: NAD-dependent epimerase/dehydratase family protein [Woeseiaceae bacterium]|nr:NAD-dependent epimerase/dehydratase family protein [Woeseiaceae bacterium]